MESRHCGQDKRIFFCPVHNASTPCSLQAFGIRCISYTNTITYINININTIIIPILTLLQITIKIIKIFIEPMLITDVWAYNVQI